MADDRRQLADEARALLREVLTNTQGHSWHVADVATDALMPLLDRVAADAAAEALTAAARWLAADAPDRTGDGLSWQAGVGNPEHAVDWCVESLRDRAAELRAPARTDEEN